MAIPFKNRFKFLDRVSLGLGVESRGIHPGG